MLAGLCWLAVLAACVAVADAPASAAGAGSGSSPPAAWVDQPVTFRAGGTTVYGTYRHPAGASGPVPAVLLIAGSGPTDRNGNSTADPGPTDTLQTLAGWLSSDGVATLRYDKLGSGQTGLGPYAGDPAAIGVAPFEQESLAALRFLAAQKGVDVRRLGVIGHSEGALFALLLADGRAGRAPRLRALGLLEPLSVRYLTLVSTQVESQVSAQEQDGQISATLAARVDGTLTEAVDQLRTRGTVPADLPYGLDGVLSPATARFLSQAERDDPATLGAFLAPRTPVLVTCSDADTQVSCGEVAHLVGGLAASHAGVDFVHLTGVDHVLKVDPSGSAADYTKPLPFSPQLQSALGQFVARALGAR